MHRFVRMKLGLSYVLYAGGALLAVMWVASLFRGYAVNVYTEVVVPAGENYTSHQRAWASTRGRMWFAYVHAEIVEESARHEKQLHVFNAPIPPEGDKNERYNGPWWLARLGVDWKATDNSSVSAEGHYAYRDLLFCVPYWLLVVLAAGSGWSIGRHPRLVRRRMKSGLCTACGYDVRATPERCPECGHLGAPALLPV
jgi:hypothetical protein